jgi:hypothetical protein
MFSSPEETLVNLERVGYFTDRKTATTVFLAGRIHRPVMLEGPAGAGKTQLAQSVAHAYGAPLLRLQCYQGINEEKAIGQYNKSLQELYVLLMSKSLQAPDWEEIERQITSRAFFMAGPLLEAIEQELPCVLLIDEIDKVDYAFEAQAFKRACSLFGLGRYFYKFDEMWVDLNEYKQPRELPPLPQWALPVNERGNRPPSGAQSNAPTLSQKGPLDATVTGQIEGCRRQLGTLLYGSILGTIAKVRAAPDIPNQRQQVEVLKWMESGVRGMTQIRQIASEIPEGLFFGILDRHNVQSLDQVPSFAVLKQLVEAMNQVRPSETEQSVA